jgi:N,N'-diacetyllegionaminate synthase
MRVAPLSLGERPLGAGAPALLVAEIGSNHDGDLGRALALVEAAAAAGADAVQFRSFRAARLAASRPPAGDRGGADDCAYLARVELRTEWHARLRDRAAAAGLVFLSAPYDAERAALLAALGVAAMPVASRELGHLALLRALGGFGRPLLLGAAGAGGAEIEAAMAAIAEGAGAPSRRPPVVLVTGPGTASRGAALRALGTLESRYACAVGWEDGLPGYALAVAAVARGACLVTKPFTDDRARPGPGHAGALDPAAFAVLAAAVREVEAALGHDLRALRQGRAIRRTTRGAGAEPPRLRGRRSG